MLQLGLTERQLFDLVGNHYDPDALLVRTRHLMGAWLLGHAVPTARPVPPHRILQIYQDLRQAVAARGIPVEARPCPNDVYLQLTAPQQQAQPPAAEDGRGGR